METEPQGPRVAADGGKRLRVFISSPSDVRPERLIAQRVVERLDREFATQFRIEPLLWEREPLVATEHFQTLITRPRETEIVVVILWSRLGLPLPADKPGLVTGRPVTGTEWEFEDAVASYRESRTPQILLYRKKSEVECSLADRDEITRRLEQLDRVEDFMRRWFHDETTGGSIAASWSFETVSEFEDLLETHLRELFSRQLEGALPEAEILWHEGSPFRSLQAFELEHAAVFYGRTRARTELRELLATRAAADCAFVLVLGASGSGKSSLVKAGLLADLLLPGMIGNVALCRYASLRPGDVAADLMGGLAVAVMSPSALPELSALEYDVASLAALLRAGSPQSDLPIRQGLAKAGVAARLTASGEARLLLIIDQLEELFTQERLAAEDRETFLATLAALARSGVVWVVATMRSDFFDRLDQSRALSGLSAASRYLLASPDETEIAQIVRQPARAAGLRFEIDAYGRGLDDVILRAASTHAGSLPLLEFTLDQLWQRREAPGVLTFAAYEALGGLEGALAQRAEQEFAALPADVQSALPSLLRALVTIGQGTRDTPTARPAPLARFPSGSAQRRLVDAFAAPHARLLVAESGEAQPRVRIAHEALLTHWPRASRQIAADRVDLQLRARLEQAAALWRAASTQEEGGRLLSVGLPLSEAEDLLARRLDELDPDVVAYIQRSSTVALQRQRARRRRTTVLLATFALLSATALIGAVLAYRSGEVANQRASELQAALGQLLGATAQALENPVNADMAPVVAALAVEGWRTARTSDAWNAAQRLPASEPVSIPSSVRALAFSADSKRLLAAGDDGAVLIDTLTRKEVRRVSELRSQVLAVAFGAKGALCASSSQSGHNGVVQLTEMDSSKELARIEHRGAVTVLAFSGDGRLLASGGEDGFVQLVETDSGTVVGRLSHERPVRAIAFSTDGNLLATGADDGTARLFETQRPREVARYAHDGSVLAVAISRDGATLATGSADKTARLFAVSSGKEILRIAHGGGVRVVAFSPDAQLIATGSDEPITRLFDRRGDEVVLSYLHHGEDYVVRFSPDGRLLATGGGEGLGRVIDLGTSQELVRIDHEGPVYAVAFSPDGRFLATGNPSVPPVHRPAAKLVTLLPDRHAVAWPLPDAGSLMFTPDSRTLVAYSRFGVSGARLFDAESGARRVLEHDDKILEVRRSPDGRVLATTRWGGAARLVVLPEGTEIARLKGEGNELAFAFSPDGRFSATAHPDATVRLFEATTHREMWRIPVGEPTKDLVFTPDARLLAIVQDQGRRARLVESATGRPVSTLSDFSSLLFSPDGRRAFVAPNSLVDTNTGREIASLPHDGWVLRQVFSPDSRYLATGSRDKFARVFDASTGKELTRIPHSDFVLGLAFSPDSRKIASVGGGTARVTNVDTGKEVVRITLMAGETTVLFSPDGKRLLLSNGHGVKIWDLDPDELFRQFCRQPGRNLTLAEWNRHVGSTTWRPTCDCWSTPADVAAAGLWPPQGRAPNCPAG